MEEADHLKDELDEVGELTLSGGQIKGVLQLVQTNVKLDEKHDDDEDVIGKQSGGHEEVVEHLELQVGF